MSICDCYHYEFKKGRCYGTKEMECCSCEGDKSRCDFYPRKQKEAANKDEITDIFTLLRSIQETGYEITFKPDKYLVGTTNIELTDPQTDRHIKIFMRVNQKYINDFNGAICDQINAMFKNMNRPRDRETDILALKKLFEDLDNVRRKNT